MKQNVKWSQFSISDKMPPSSCEKVAVCFIASANRLISTGLLCSYCETVTD